MTIENAYGQQYLYNISVDGKSTLTGFKIAGQAGIITSLHGVVGARKIVVTEANNLNSYLDDIKITYWDVANDLCILNSKSISEILINKGLTTRSQFSKQTLNGVHVIIKGFPWSVPQYQTVNAILDGDNSVTNLYNLIPKSDDREALSNRKSPDLAQQVINIHGEIAPGHSGSPVLFENQVIGIVDGGLLLGPGYAWAIPYGNIHFVLFARDDPSYMRILRTNKALWSNEPVITTLPNEKLPNPQEMPFRILSIDKRSDNSLDFKLSNESPIELGTIGIKLRYYSDDLTEVLEQSYDSETIPAGQSNHFRFLAPNYIKNYTAIQYDVIIYGYPESGQEYKKTFLKRFVD